MTTENTTLTTPADLPLPRPNTAASDILSELRLYGRASQFSLASRLAIPEPTVRRAIQDLRRLGYTIPSAVYNRGQYELKAA